MDREGIAVSVCFPTVFIGPSDIPDAAAGATACRTYNDWFHGADHRPELERLYAPALVPLQDPAAAVRESERAVVELGARAIYLQPYAGARHLDDPEYELVLQLQPGTATERGDDGVVWCWLSQLDNVPRSELPRLHRHNVPPPRPRSWAA